MKGIVHFLSGLAVATFFPEAVNLAAAQSSFVLVLGGIGGLLPDTLDFRLSRFLEKPDVDIDPHPAHPDPQEIAETVAGAINRVAGTKQKLIVQLRTMRLGTDRWRQYWLRFDVENREVVVKLGPAVNTSQMPVPERREEQLMPRGPLLVRKSGVTGSVHETVGSGEVGTGVTQAQPQAIGRAAVDARMLPTYGEETEIDIFSGPSFALEWRKGQVEIDFIPWHRQWSHSLTMAALFGLLAGMLFGTTAGAIAALAYTTHIVEDQLGFLGSNLLFPLTRRRVPGLRWVHSGDAAPNFFAVWTALLIILFNLDRFSPRPQINPLPYFGLAWLPALALLVGFLIDRYRARVKGREALGALHQTDLRQESLEVVDA